jgi:branched-chain amino acid transport system permease protein
VVTFAAGFSWWWLAGHYGLEILTEIAIYAIFAVSIDFLVGYVGLVTMGHAGFMGVGAYAFAGAAFFLGWPPGAAMAAAVALGAAAGLAIGAFIVRVSGVFFIMVTLAISMMFYSWAFKSRAFGGDDGRTGVPRLDLSPIGIDLADASTYCLLVLILALAVYLVFEGLTRSPFGRTLVAIRQNESRMRALGCRVQAYKLAAFAIAATVASFAGALQVQHTHYVHPSVSHWTYSGEGLIFVIIGGIGTLIGPVIGTAVTILLRAGLSLYTQHWLILLGAFFVAVVLVAPDGIYGRLRSLTLRLSRPAAAAAVRDA